MLKTERIIEAFKKIDRADFVLDEYRDEAYSDYPLPIGHGQTISQPSTVAFMLELLEPQEGEKILDVGSGSGWTTALLARIVGPGGKVFGLELIPELVKFGSENLSKYNFPWSEIQQGEKGHFAPHRAGGSGTRFDRTLVSAAGDEMPQALIDRLKIGGRLVMPIQNSVWKADKISETKLNKTEFPGFVFVPLK
ncbi:MAG: protein-L-isoaspartate O-methyltransferase [Candidatus Spechtbacteria bacterium]|nr:protein-L-isoaspartate O-methyltransferase [Candidatus Spechtbacteria bacterium]